MGPTGKKHIYRLFVGLLLLSIAVCIEKADLFSGTGDFRFTRFENTFQEKEQIATDAASSLCGWLNKTSADELFKRLDDPYFLNLNKNHIYLCVFNNGRPVFWSGNNVPLSAVRSLGANQKFVHLMNGWYYIVQSQPDQNTSVYALLLVKRNYKYENQFLQNTFNEAFDMDASVSLQFEADPTSHPFHNLSGDIVAYLQPGKDQSLPWWRYWIIVLLYLVGAILVLHSAYVVPGIERRFGNITSLLLFTSFLIVLRVLMQVFRLPDFLYQEDLFNAEHYASSVIFPNLGDLLISSIFLFSLVYYLIRTIKVTKRKKSDAHKFRVSVFVMLLTAMVQGIVVDDITSGVIVNSSIPFNVNNLFDLNGFSVVGIFIVGLHLLVFYLLAERAGDLISHYEPLSLFTLLYLIMAGAGSALINYFFIGASFQYLYWSVLLIVFVMLLRIGNYSRSLASYVLLLSVFSLFAAFLFVKSGDKREHAQREVLAARLSNDEDPGVELLYAELDSAMLNDYLIQQALSDLSTFDKQAFDKRLMENYFTGYFSKYNISTYLFDQNNIAVQPIAGDSRKHKKSYFDELLARHGSTTLAKHLYYIENTDEKEIYIGEIMLADVATNDYLGTLFITFESKLIPEEIGFPELLLSSEGSFYNTLLRFSFAKYKGNTLIKRFGRFHYPLSPEKYIAKVPDGGFIEDGTFCHLIYPVPGRFLVILSAPQPGWLERITTFSYLFFFFGLTLLILFLIRGIILRQGVLPSLNIHIRMQLMLVTLILTSLLAFGFGTVYYITAQYKTKNYNIISEKIHSVLIEVQHKLGTKNTIEQVDRNYMRYILSKFSSVFFTDINLYNQKGMLLASSRPQLFSQGLIGKQMNPDAYKMLVVQRISEFIHDEWIGNLQYQSAYVPFKNSDGEVLAYLNLPYFAKQSTLESEISSFLIALINIYVFLLVISVVLALFLSNIITRPLRMLQTTIAGMQIGGGGNKPIAYHEQDEIGALVKVYNKKVEELRESADLLARTERESAWREMAKQVAHEIKNPLTPMKLNIQHLQRIIQEDPEQAAETTNKVCRALVEQIDTLSNIAGEFSDFAKLPGAHYDTFNLVACIEQTIALFKDHPDIEIKFNKPELPALVFADRDHLIRIFNNLIKNAIQAIPDHRDGIVVIRITEDQKGYIAAVEDNGIGIAPESVRKIFEPNFTTKTAGTGLGLAMVKNMVEQMKGRVWFETTKDTGTVFYVWLLKKD